MRPDNFEDISAVIALYRPGPMGADSHNKYANRKNGREPVVPIHPELADAAGRDPRRHLRPDRLPGAGHRDRPAPGRLHPGRRRPAAPGDGQEEEGRAGRPVREVLGGHAGQRLLRGGDQDAVGHPGAVLRLRLQQGAFGRLRPAVLLDGLPQGATTRPSTWPRCSPRSRTTRTRWPSTWPSAGGWASRCCRRASTPPTPTSPRSAPTSGSGCRRCATSAATWWPRSPRARKANSGFTDFADYLRKVDALACNKRTVEALIKAGAFDSLGHHRKGLIQVYEASIDAVLSTKRAEAIGQFDLFGFDDDCRTPGSATCSPSGCPRASGTSRCC